MEDRFPRPWRTLKLKDSFQVQDAEGYPLAYVYFAEDERRRELTHRMSEEEARLIARGIVNSAGRHVRKPMTRRG